MIKEMPNASLNQVKRTQVDRVVVSTIVRDDMVKMMDESISMLGDVAGISYKDLERSDLRTPGDYETMVFDCDKKGEVINWTEKDFARYQSKEEAEKGHAEMVERWENA